MESATLNHLETLIDDWNPDMSREPQPRFLLTRYDSVEFIDEGVDGCIRDGGASTVKILHTLDPRSSLSI